METEENRVVGIPVKDKQNDTEEELDNEEELDKKGSFVHPHKL